MGKGSRCDCVGVVQFPTVSSRSIRGSMTWLTSLGPCLLLTPFPQYFNLNHLLLFLMLIPLILKVSNACLEYAQCWLTPVALFRSECARNMIILDCSRTLVDPEEPVSDIPPKPEQIEVLYLRLKNWYDGRPQSLLPANYPSPENLLTA